jgi:CheY-like chemotaxis protein
MHQNVRNLLVVDDNRDLAETLVVLLEDDQTLDVRVAYSAESAMREIREQVPDLVLLDLGLPDIDGREVARELRRLYGPRIRLIAFTGSTDASEAELRGIGFDAIIEKPVPLAQLIDVLQNFGVRRPGALDPSRQVLLARRHVADGERRIERLKAIVHRLDEQGLPSADAQRMLATFMQTIELMREHLAFEEEHSRSQQAQPFIGGHPAAR